MKWIKATDQIPPVGSIKRTISDKYVIPNDHIWEQTKFGIVMSNDYDAVGINGREYSFTDIEWLDESEEVKPRGLENKYVYLIYHAGDRSVGIWDGNTKVTIETDFDFGSPDDQEMFKESFRELFDVPVKAIMTQEEFDEEDKRIAEEEKRMNQAEMEYELINPRAISGRIQILDHIRVKLIKPVNKKTKAGKVSIPIIPDPDLGYFESLQRLKKEGKDIGQYIDAETVGMNLSKFEITPA